MPRPKALSPAKQVALKREQLRQLLVELEEKRARILREIDMLGVGIQALERVIERYKK